MVHVIIKAANGAVNDFRVSGAAPQWTVGQLKNYLYRHYPTHPPVTSQKLIHSGRLLLDSQHLADILTRPDDDRDQVVVHLVAYERSASAPALSTQTSAPNSPPSVRETETVEEEEEEEEEDRARDGERRGEVVVDSVGGTSDSSTAEGREPPHVAAPPQDHTPHPWLRYRPHVQHMPRFPGPMLQNIPMFPMGGGYPYPPFYMPPYAAVNPAQMQQWYHAYYTRPGAAGGGVEGEGVGGEGEDIDLPNVPDQPDNPDIDQDDVPVNAGGLMMGGPQLQARRDLVDYGYMFLMAMFLVCVAYITSSFGRLVLFLAGILFMLMNQAGWFSLQRRRQNVPAAADDLPDPLARHQAQQRAGRPNGATDGAQGNRATEQEGREATGSGSEERGEEGEAVAGEDTPDGASESVAEHEDTTAAPPPPPPPRPGLLATAFTFVTTFFTSLVPQQQPELQFN